MVGIVEKYCNFCEENSPSVMRSTKQDSNRRSLQLFLSFVGRSKTAVGLRVVGPKRLQIKRLFTFLLASTFDLTCRDGDDVPCACANTVYTCQSPHSIPPCITTAMVPCPGTSIDAMAISAPESFAAATASSMFSTRT